jgi:hypothetical protein
LCFRGILIRLVTGASWVDVEAILDHQFSDTTLRARRDEWIDAGVFEALRTEALAAFDRTSLLIWRRPFKDPRSTCSRGPRRPTYRRDFPRCCRRRRSRQVSFPTGFAV